MAQQIEMVEPRSGLRFEHVRFWDAGQRELKGWSGDLLRGEVSELLSVTPFVKGEGLEGAFRRGERYRSCGKFRMSCECLNGHRQFAYRLDCNVRGCERCGSRLRGRLSRRFVRVVKSLGLDFSDCRFVTFTWAWVPSADMDVEAKWFMGECLRYCREFFSGGVICQEVVEKEGGFWYVHAHAVVSRIAGLSWDYTVLQAGWLQLMGSRVQFDKIESFRGGFRGAISYALKYSMKADYVRFMSAGVYVDWLRSLFKAKLVRAFGCFYGRRKGAMGKPGGGVKGEGSEATGTNTLVQDSTNLSAQVVPKRLVCRVCGGRLYFFVSLEPKGVYDV